jgi:hypothetical protein
MIGDYAMSDSLSRQIVNNNTRQWNEAIEKARLLLSKAENRAARLKGAIQTFTDLRDSGQPFDEQEAELLKAS